ncbi:MAG: tetratricopeptide repeat protein [Aggregatilineales bacterium]
MSFLQVPQVGFPPVYSSAVDEQLLLAMPHAEESTDLFATDADPNIQRLARLALRRPSPQAADYFNLGDLCAQRACEGKRLSILYMAKALQAYKRAGQLTQSAQEQTRASSIQAELAEWAVNIAHNTPSLSNIGAALWAVAEVPPEHLNAEICAAARELTQQYAAALRAKAASQLPAVEAPTSWLDSSPEALLSAEEDKTDTQDDASRPISERLSRTLTFNTTARDQVVPELAGNDEDFQRGELIGERYRVWNILEGGMGIIYICLDEEAKRLVALKTFQARYLRDDAAKRRFENEARLWVEMDKHPNVVRAYKVASFGKSRLSERPHIILEYVIGAEGLGSDLRGWIKHKRLTPQLSLEIALGVCNGMAYAVSKKNGFVHRDLKPANILVRHDIVAKVTDFGLGRALDSLTESQEMPVLSPEQLKHFAEGRFTQTGKVMGTLVYMAPEQYTPRLQPLDARADIFAFGTILYEMLTGIRLFSGANSIPALRELHRRPVSFPPDVAEKLPPALCQLTLRCLQVQREERPQTWQELRDELINCYQALTGNLPQLDSSPAAMQGDDLMNKAYSLTELKCYADALRIYEQALELDPKSAWIWARKARLLRLMKRYPEALEAFERALTMQPNFTWAWYNKGIVHERLKQYAEAQAAYARATHLNPHDIWAAYNHARLLLQLGQPQPALELIQSVIDVDPEHALSHVLRGRILLRLQRLPEALAAFDRALQLDHQLGEALIGRGEVLNALKRSTEATSAFLHASRLLPKDVTAWLRLADVYLANGDVLEAQSALEQAKRMQPKNSGIWLRFGRLHLHCDRFTEALEAYDQVLERYPQHVAALAGKSLALLAEARYSEAITCLQAVLVQRPNDLNALSRLGIAYLRSGDAASALSIFDRALQQRGDLAWLWAKRALALQQLQHNDEAAAAWQRAIGLKPTQFWYRTQLASLQVRLGHFAEALASVEPAQTPELHVLRATILRRMKRYEEALEACDRALALSPEYAWAHSERGILLERMKRFPEALDAHEQALQSAPHVLRHRLNILRLLQQLGRHDEALQVCLESLAALPSNNTHLACLHAQHGEILRRLHHYTDALEAYTQARDLAPHLPLAWEGIGLTYAALGKHAEALSALERATQLQPQNARLWYNYGAALIENGNYPEAIRALNRALALRPDYPQAELKRREARRKLDDRQQRR